MKTEAKAVAGHTAGPWKVLGHYVTTDKDPEGELVVCVMSNWRNKVEFAAKCASEEDQANARLIAAAPELLEACKAVLESEESTLGDGGSVIGDQYRSLIQAAIEKAEGRQ